MKLKRVFFEQPQIVFHLAAFFANQNSIDHPERDLQDERDGNAPTAGILAVREGGALRVCVIGLLHLWQRRAVPLREEFMSLNLTTPYQITKMLGELYCNFFFDHYDLPVVKTRVLQFIWTRRGARSVPERHPEFHLLGARRGDRCRSPGQARSRRDFTVR